MKFGIHYLMSCADEQSPVVRYRETIEQALRAEALGFESVWPAEQHFDQHVCALPCPTLLLAAIAARTRRLRLGTAIVQLPLHHPLRTAEELATLAVLSNGRVEFGVGRGSHPRHFAGLGVPATESAARFGEALELIRRAWTEPSVSFDGAFHSVRDVSVAPRPVQLPHPSIRVAANSRDTIEFAGRSGYSVLVAAHVNPWPKLTELLSFYHEARRAAGHAPATPDDISVLMPLFVAPSQAEAKRITSPTIARYMYLVGNALAPLVAECQSDAERGKLLAVIERMRTTSFETLNDSMGVMDTPRACVERLRQIREQFGVGRVIGWFNFGGLVAHDDVMSAMELFAREVMPAFGS